MERQIRELRQKKFTIEQIAEELGMTVGQVKYRMYGKASKPEEEHPSKNPKPENKTAEPVIKKDFCPLPPPYYGDDEIILMIQSPTTAYVYWEITWPVMHRLADYLNTPYDQLAKALRIYDVSDLWFNGHNAHWYREIILDEHADNWFIYDLLPDRTYIVDWGVLWEDRFIPLLRSGPKAAPPNREAGEYTALVSVIPTRKEKARPQWFENFSTYSLY